MPNISEHLQEEDSENLEIQYGINDEHSYN